MARAQPPAGVRGRGAPTDGRSLDGDRGLDGDPHSDGDPDSDGALGSGSSDPAGTVARLFAAEAATLVRLARFFVADRAAAEDLVQEAFIRLSRNLHRVRGPGAEVAYLRAIVLNLCRDHNRRGLMSLRHRPPADVEPEPPDEVVAGREQSRAVVAALASLPRRQRDCLVLRYYLDLGPPEIAATLGLSPNSVKTHLRRGLRTLEDLLGTQHDGGGGGR